MSLRLSLLGKGGDPERHTGTINNIRTQRAV